MTAEAARAHVDRFNTAVVSGDWSALIATFHPAATMTFIGPGAGPFIGRDAIAAAYAADPPTDTIRICEVLCGGNTEIVTYEWSRGGTGSMEIQHSAGQIIRLLVRFD
jgi:hypothetical protein